MSLRRQPSRALHHTQDDVFVPDKSPPSAKKAKKTPTKKTPTKKTPAKKEPVKELPKPPGYPKEESELKFSVIQGDQAWGYNDTRAEPPNKGVKIAPMGPNDCLEGVTVVVARDESDCLICAKPNHWWTFTECPLLYTPNENTVGRWKIVQDANNTVGCHPKQKRAKDDTWPVCNMCYEERCCALDAEKCFA